MKREGINQPGQATASEFNPQITPVPSSGATPVKYAALSFGISQGRPWLNTLRCPSELNGARRGGHELDELKDKNSRPNAMRCRKRIAQGRQKGTPVEWDLRNSTG